MILRALMNLKNPKKLLSKSFAGVPGSGARTLRSRSIQCEQSASSLLHCVKLRGVQSTWLHCPLSHSHCLFWLRPPSSTCQTDSPVTRIFNCQSCWNFLNVSVRICMNYVWVIFMIFFQFKSETNSRSSPAFCSVKCLCIVYSKTFPCLHSHLSRCQIS